MTPGDPGISLQSLSFTIFLPGVSTNAGSQNSRSSTVVGLPQNTISITMDGISISNNLQSDDGFFALVTPRLDAVEEVTLTTAAAQNNPLIPSTVDPVVAAMLTGHRSGLHDGVSAAGLHGAGVHAERHPAAVQPVGAHRSGRSARNRRFRSGSAEPDAAERHVVHEDVDGGVSAQGDERGRHLHLRSGHPGAVHGFVDGGVAAVALARHGD